MHTTGATNFQPTNQSLGQIRAAIPARLFERSASRSISYLLRDIGQVILLGITVHRADQLIGDLFWLPSGSSSQISKSALRALLWLTYWWYQGLSFTGVWVIGHECGHAAFSSSKTVCDIIGFITHTLLWTPYFSWRISHHRHHANHGSMEKDEVYVPKSRADLGIPKASTEDEYELAVHKYFGDTPLYTLFRLICQQFLAFPAYLLFNVSGQKRYPPWTNHFNPRSVLFRDTQLWDVIISNCGILAMIYATLLCCLSYGVSAVIKYYAVPWLAVSHWFVMITYLHHTAPHIPHYRKGEWTYVRGAAATTDRSFLGWHGRYFLHDARFHVVHHFFPAMPWYHGEEATTYLMAVLGKHYLYSEEPAFKALWRSYNECQFVDNDGDILFYRNKRGLIAKDETRKEGL